MPSSSQEHYQRDLHARHTPALLHSMSASLLHPPCKRKRFQKPQQKALTQGADSLQWDFDHTCGPSHEPNSQTEGAMPAQGLMWLDFLMQERPEIEGCDKDSRGEFKSSSGRLVRLQVPSQASSARFRQSSSTQIYLASTSGCRGSFCPSSRLIDLPPLWLKVGTLGCLSSTVLGLPLTGVEKEPKPLTRYRGVVGIKRVDRLRRTLSGAPSLLFLPETKEAMRLLSLRESSSRKKTSISSVHALGGSIRPFDKAIHSKGEAFESFSSTRQGTSTGLHPRHCSRQQPQEGSI